MVCRFRPHALLRIVPVFWRSRGNDGTGKVRTGERHEPCAELFAQPRACAPPRPRLGEFVELERAERHADEPRDREAEMAEHVSHFAVLALADAKVSHRFDPCTALDCGFDLTVMDAADRHAGAQFVELSLRYRTMRPHAVAPQPAGRGQFQDAGQRAVIGEEQQAFGIEVEPADADEAGQGWRQALEDGRPALRVGVRRHQAARLVIEEEPRAIARRQRFAIDGDAVAGGHIERWRQDDLAIDDNAPGGDPKLRLAARGEAGAGDHFGDAGRRLCPV